MARKTSLRTREEALKQFPTYYVFSELTNPPTGLSFVQPLRGDAEPAKKEVSRIGMKSRPPLAASVTQISDPKQWRVFKVVSFKVYGA